MGFLKWFSAWPAPAQAISIIVQGCRFMVQTQEFSCAMMVSIRLHHIHLHHILAPDMKTTSHHYAPRFDPNRMFDTLLRQLEMANDEALCAELHVAPFVIARIRSGLSPIPPSLLIRINELSGINVRELRRLMGDRRSEYRMGDFMPARESAHATPAHRRRMDADDAGLPNSVQWA